MEQEGTLLALSIALVAGGVVGTVQASFFEWAFHRYWLHRPWRPKECFNSHALVHHQLCKYEDTFVVVDEEQRESLSFAWWGGPTLIVINVVPWAVLGWACASFVGWPLVLTLVGTLGATVALYYAGYESLHFQMHKPGTSALKRLPYFRFIERHHRIHHVKMTRNLNVLLPLADWILGTLVLREVPHPASNPEAARRLARRHSVYGARLRREGREGRE